MTVFLLVFASLLLIAGIGCYCILQISVFRHPMPDLTNPKILSVTKWKVLIPLIREGVQWLDGHASREITIRSDDGTKLFGRFVPQENARGTVILFHGFRSSYAIDFCCALKFYYDQGFHLLICDQRAHGNSGGKCISYGVRERHDVVAWTNYISREFGEEHPVFLLGLSMGATTVLMSSVLEHKANIRGIIADCGFTSPKEILTHVAGNKMHLPTKIVIPILGALTSLFCGFRLDECSTTDALKCAKYPVVLVHGTDDDFVPCRMTEENYEACTGEKHLLLVEGADHGFSYLVDQESYESLVTRFLNTHCPDPLLSPYAQKDSV